MAVLRAGLLREIVTMSIDTLRTNKMRSALTVLGVVIGITSIVGMTSLIRGFDDSLRESLSELGPDTILVQKWGALSFASGKSFLDVARRPNLSREDAIAIARECPSVAIIDAWLGAMGNTQSRIYYGNEKTKAVPILGATENWAAVNFAKLGVGRLFIPAEVDHRRQVVVLGKNPWDSLFPNIDPIGKVVRIGANEFTVIGVLEQASEPRRLLDRRGRLRGHPVQRTRKVLRQGAQGFGEDFREHFQPGGVPYGDDCRRAARRHARRGDARGGGADAHPPQAQPRAAERFRPRRRRMRC